MQMWNQNRGDGATSHNASYRFWHKQLGERKMSKINTMHVNMVTKSFPLIACNMTSNPRRTSATHCR